MSPQEAVNSQVARMVAVNDALFAATADADSELKTRVDEWHAQALLWISLGSDIASGKNPRAADWQTTGNKLMATAQDIGAAADDDTVGARATAFLQGMPGALAAVVAGTANFANKKIVAPVVDAAADAAKNALDGVLSATWPVLLAGGAVVVFLGYLLATGKAESLIRAVKV